MKRLALGYVLGLLTMALIGLGLMLTGTPFREMPVKHDGWKGNLVVSTPKFLVSYEGANVSGGGSFYATVSGRFGTLPALWHGYGGGFTAGDRGIDTLHVYEPNFGIATLFFFGGVIRVEKEATLLRVQDGLFDLRAGKAVVVVDEDGFARRLDDSAATKLVDSLPQSLTTFEDDGSISLPSSIVDEKK